MASPPPRARALWLVPLVLLGLGGLAWLLLAGLPFGGGEPEPATPRVETVAEGTAPPARPIETATVVDLPGEQPPSGETDTTAIFEQTPAAAPPNVSEGPPPGTVPPSATAPPVNPPQTSAAPAPVRETPPPTRTAPPPTRTAPPPRRTTPPPVRTVPPPPRTVPAPREAPRRAEPAREMNDSQAASVLRSYITSRDYYDMDNNCLRISSRGYKNRGYAYEVWESCGNGPSRLLGRWRVDSLTREVFRQYGDGRYLDP